MVKEVIYKNILENMSDGVMTIDLDGRIIAFNPAASSILGIKREDAIGKTFAEVFLMLEGNDEFNQAILDAIYESHISHHRTVKFNRGGSLITLSLTTSFLHEKEDGKLKKAGVIAVFSDITEIERLREKEVKLTEELKKNHEKLQQAYIQLEESKKELESALKKVQVIRAITTVFVLVLFLGTGFYVWNKKFHPATEVPQARFVKGSKKPIKTFTVSPTPVQSTISLTGNLRPLRILNIVSPFRGKVKKRYFDYGEYVKKGQLLIEMDTSEIEANYRSAKITYIKALQELKRLENWENSPEVKQARRAVTRARLFLEAQRRSFQEARRLYEKGIIPANEYETAKRELKNAELDFIAAKEELDSVLDKGNKQNVSIARIEMENARIKLKELEEQLNNAKIYAPVSGVIIIPQISSDKDHSKIVEKGVSFDQGEVMISIGDMEGISVKASVDEVDVSKIRKGQDVIITGDAFPDIRLKGKIASISSQASVSSEQGIPYFEVVVTVDHLTSDQRKKLCIGMSANLEVIVYSNPEALMVPIEAVIVKDDGKFVKVLDKKTKQIKEVKVKTGITTLDSVEIIKGLKAGDCVIVSNV